MKTALVVQPYMASYRTEAIEAVASVFRTTLVTSSVGQASGYGEHSFKSGLIRHLTCNERSWLRGRVLFQGRAVTEFMKLLPDVTWITGNPRYLSFWVILLLGRVLGRSIFVHGQGLYKHPVPSAVQRLIFRAMVRMSRGYLAYTEGCKASLVRIGCAEQKITVVYNSLINEYPIDPSTKTGAEQAVLFLGRLRPGCGLEMLIEAVSRLRARTAPGVRLKVIGGGELLGRYREQFSDFDWIEWVGECFDNQEISRLSANCFVACYPGNSGLSIVHYFSLSLPVLIHDQDHLHFGPEFEYVVDGVNGFRFALRDGAASVESMLSRTLSDKFLRASMHRASYETYVRLVNPSFGERVVKALSVSSYQAPN